MNTSGLLKRKSLGALTPITATSPPINLILGNDDENTVQAVSSSSKPGTCVFWSTPETTGEKPPPLRSHSATLIHDKMFVFGGFGESPGGPVEESFYSNEMYILNTDSLRWSRVQPLDECRPSARKSHSACHIGTNSLGEDLLAVFGGGSEDSYFNDIYIFNTCTHKWTLLNCDGEGSSKPSPRRGHSMVFYDGAVYVFGGGDGIHALNDLYRLKIGEGAMQHNMEDTTFVWERLETIMGASMDSFGRGYHTSTLIDSKMIVYGGCDGSIFFNDLHILDLGEKSLF